MTRISTLVRRIRSHLTFANAMSLVAVFIALGGAAYAVNTVRSSDIVDGEVKIADIGRGAVGTSEVLDDTATGGGLTAADLRTGSVGTAEVADNSLKAADLSSSALGGHVVQVSVASEFIPGDLKEVVAECPTGARVVGGGFVAGSDSFRPLITRSYPVNDHAWLVRAIRTESPPGPDQNWELSATAMCVK